MSARLAQPQVTLNRDPEPRAAPGHSHSLEPSAVGRAGTARDGEGICTHRAVGMCGVGKGKWRKEFQPQRGQTHGLAQAVPVALWLTTAPQSQSSHLGTLPWD